MIDNFMGDLDGQQKEMQDKLTQFVITESLDGIIVEGNAARRITNISISDDLMTAGDKDQIEDLLVTAVNRFLTQSGEIEGAEAQKMMQNMLPPGFGDLFK